MIFKRFFFKFLFALSLLSLFILGLDWFLLVSGYGEFLGNGWVGIQSVGGYWEQVGASFAMIFLPFLTFALHYLLGLDDSLKTKTDQGDSIRLSPKSVEKCVRKKVAETYPEVMKVGVEASQHYSLLGLIPTTKIDIVISIAVNDQVKISDLSKKIRGSAASVLTQLFGLEDSNNIHVHIYDVIAGKPVRRKGGSKKTADESSKPKELKS